LVVLSLLALVACNATPVDPTNPPDVPAVAPEVAQAMAMKLWRDDDRARHPKGSCSGCHGADFYDLARIGSTDKDIKRRAIIDGASVEEAAALAQAIGQLRAKAKLPAENARSFRPFQPGGAVLPGARPIERDIAFAESLKPLLPTLFGSRIATLEAAKQARDEMLDLAKGTNAAGANPKLLNLRSLPSGIRYPLWSADIVHGEDEATLDDWLADIALDAPDAKKAQWHALQDAYLANPTNDNFWRMYSGVDSLTATKPFERCAPDDRNPESACGAVDDFARHKLKSAMIGQHLMRTLDAAKTGPGENAFTKGALAFSYLDAATHLDGTLGFRRDVLLPGEDMWEIGDRARTMFPENQAPGSLRTSLQALGLPKFVQDSVSATTSVGVEQERLRVTWFWIGFTFDPSFARISGSNSTRVGEYMVGSLIDQNMHLHNAFAQNMRLLVKGYLPEANWTKNGRDVVPATPAFRLWYSYFVGYGREVIEWKEPRTDRIPQALKDAQQALWQRFTGNGFRMAMLLQLDALDTADAATRAKLVDSLDTVDAGGQRLEAWGAGPFKRFFDCYQQRLPGAYTGAERVSDYALMNTLNERLTLAARYDASAPVPATVCQ
jgi:hypothetical protein